MPQKRKRTRPESTAKRLFNRWQRQVEKKIKRARIPVLLRKPVPMPKKPHRIIAYDLETTSIAAGTPKPLYLTAYGAEFHYSGAITSIQHLLQILESRFLVPELNGCRFVAWNGNNYDVYFIAAALLHEPRYFLRPYMTGKKGMRGLKVSLNGSSSERGVSKQSWEFLDGIAMLGMVGVSLEKFLHSFAPDYLKLQSPDWSKEQFNPDNPDHVSYAERDSEGLFHGMMKAQEIVWQNFQCPLKPTIGNTGITIFQSFIPPSVIIRSPPRAALTDIRGHAMRGGYCHCVDRYHGPIWKYDINQAYAAAMREAWLPAGGCAKLYGEPKYVSCFFVQVRASNPRNKIPFYVRDMDSGQLQFATTEFHGWITSSEYRQLKAERWKLEVIESWIFEDRFNMREYVDRLEQLRMNAPGGPKSAQGQLIKYIGNNSYGKTVEILDGLEFALSNEQPDNYSEYMVDGIGDYLSHIWYRIGDPQTRPYHQPQIGAFITAHVRMVVRRAILKAPENWLYADTDCVIFSRPVDLDIDETRYGAWKVEEQGSEYRIIAKKVYADSDATVRHAKGVNVRSLTPQNFIDWYNGTPPIQRQTQRQNFLRVMAGTDMFIERVKVGQRIGNEKLLQR